MREIDSDGKMRSLSTSWFTVWGIAWSPRGTICVSGQQGGSSPGLYEITRDGTLRVLQRLTGFPYLQDISASGEVLFIQSTPEMKMEWHEPGEEARDLSCLDWTLCRDLSRDGKWILFDETGPGSAGVATVYMRATDGSPAVRLGEGIAGEFSPDGRWALVQNRGEHDTLTLLPTGAGRERTLPLPRMAVHQATWMPDGGALCVAGFEPGHGMRLYRYEIDSEQIRPISEEGVGTNLGKVSPDGRLALARTVSGSFGLYPTEGGAPQPLEGIHPGERPYNWAPDGTAVFAFERGKIPARIFRVEVATGKRELWHAVTPRNSSGVSGINSLQLSEDGRSLAISYVRMSAELYIARGIL